MTRRRSRWFAARVTLWSIALAGALPSACKPRTAAPSASSSASAAVAASALVPAPVVPVAAAGPTFADLVAKADPAVVFVKTVQEREIYSGRRVLGEALGSAFVYDSSGLILTNNHVIEGATDIRVILGQSQLLKATVVGRDPPTDVAILKVDASGLTALPLGDSDLIRVGDWVIAIGNPFGLTHTVSAGILSAKDRTNQDLRQNGGGLDEAGYYDFLQTDASINPGNSGGPLLDTAGRVVGINTAIRDRANGIGFAIPINMVREILPRLMRDGKLRRSAIGLNVAPVAAEDVARLGLSQPTGALVRRLEPGGPAERAGIAMDDVIRGFNGQPVDGPQRLRWLVSLAGVGATASVHIVRSGREFDLKVTLNELAGVPSSGESQP